jgi:tetratricopeptide (TPR) repeat protein
MGKFARRYRFGLFMAVLLAGLVVAGVVVGLAQALRADRAERQARQSLAKAEAALRDFKAQQQLVKDSLAKAEQEKAEKERALEREQVQKTNALASLATAEKEKTRAEKEQLDAVAAQDEAKGQRDRARQERDKAEELQREAEAARLAATNATITARNALAESRAQQAKLEEAMFMLLNLSEKLRSIGHVDLLREVTENVLAHYQSLPPAGQSEEALSRRLRAFQNLGHVLTIQGESAKAEAAYRTALEIAENLSAGDPERTNWQEELFACHEQIGGMLEARGASARALQEFETSQAIAQRAAARGLSGALWQERLLRGYIKVGDARRVLADKPGAVSAYKAALDIAQRCSELDTNNPAWQMGLSVCHAKLGAVWPEEGGPEAAMTHCQTSLRIAEQYAGTDPANSDWQSALADSHDNLGDVFLARKQTKEAQKHYQEALRIRQALAQSDPGNTRWQRDWLHSRFNLASAQAGESKGAKRLKVFLAGWKPVVNLTWMPVDVGQQLFAADEKNRKPLEAVRRTMDEAEEFARTDPGNIQWEEDLASYRWLMGDMFLQARRKEEALSAYLEALRIRQELAGRDTNAAALQYGLALSHANVAVALRRLSRPDEALAEARQTLDLLSDMTSRWPGNFVLAEGPRAREGNIRSKLQLSPEQREDFRAIFAQGFDTFQAARAADSKNAELWGYYCSERAVFAMFYDDIGKAVDYAQKAVGVWQDLSRAASANMVCQQRLMQAYLALGAFHLLNRQPQETIRISQLALRRNPVRVDFDALLVLGYLFADQYDKARSVALEHKDLKVSPWQTFGEAVLKDLHRLGEKGLTQLDMARIEQRLAADLSNAPE